jgi:outer membrane protein TolC
MLPTELQRTAFSIQLVAFALLNVLAGPLFAQPPNGARTPATGKAGQHRVARINEREQRAAPMPAASSPLRLTIEQARETALANNRQLQLGQLNLAEKQLAASAATKDYFPKLLGAAAYLHFNDDLGSVLASRERSLGGATIGPGGVIQIPTVSVPGRSISANVLNQDSAFATVMVAQPITKLIGVSALVDLARADVGIAAAQLDMGTRQLLSGVNQAYYGLLAARQILTALGLQAQMIDPLVKANPSPLLRLSQLELRRGLVEAHKQAAELADLLNQLLGFPPGTTLELLEPEPVPVPIATVDEAAALAVGNSPQIREAQQNILKAQAGLKAANMAYLPDVSVFGAYTGQTAADYLQEDFSTLGVVGTYTFFEWGKRNLVHRQRQTQMVLAMKNVEAVRETVDLDARKAFLAYRQAEELLQIASETAKARQEAEKGIADVPTLMAAKSATAKAQLDQLQAAVNHRLAHAKLLETIGQP